METMSCGPILKHVFGVTVYSIQFACALTGIITCGKSDNMS